jgi:hypothetical protein
MKPHRPLLAAALLITAAATAAVPVTAQTPAAAEIVSEFRAARAAAPAELDQSLIRMQRRPAVPFVPFEVRHPETGQPTPYDSVLRFPDGSEATAGAYYASLNEIERGLTRDGYSLRDDWTTLRIQVSAITAEALRPPAFALRAFRPVPNAPTRPFADFLREARAAPPTRTLPAPRTPFGNAPGAASSTTSGPAGARGSVRPEAGQVQEAHIPRPVVVDSTWEYPFSIGDEDLFAGSVNARLRLRGTRERMSVRGAASAGVAIFGVSSDIVRLDASVDAPVDGSSMSGQIRLDVLPVGTILNLPLSGASVSRRDSISHGLDVEFANVRVLVGPIPIQVRAGVNGRADLTYQAAMNVGSAAAEFRPVVRSNLYVQAGVDLVVGGAGAAADMTLVQYDLVMQGGATALPATVDGQTQLGVRQQFHIAQNLRMLSGSAHAFAYTYVPRWGLPPYTRKEWRWEIWSWAGYQPVNGTLVNGSLWRSLDVPAN